ncbi:HTH domain-containing protein [Paenibacillus sp. Soil750]|uniref:HTH domain-containing protein n=1 Tax=Paenibacillus sp. Soil750 TaxID=1736398 RepID=UPI000AF143BA|nr:HTH domain-containing protein [Paenibacillus sp. Soil750]
MSKKYSSLMREKGFSEQEIKELEINPNVLNVTEKSITYAPAFKIAAVQAYEKGQTPMGIFLMAGFNVDIIGHKKPKHCLKRWRNIYVAQGEKGLLEERRGKGSTGRRAAVEMSIEEKLKQAEARIKLLEVENEFLKKLEALEKQKMLRKH